MMEDVWTKEVARAAANALVAGLFQAQRHGDTGFVTRTLSMVPRDLQWRYAQWIHAFSPFVLRAKGGEVSGRLTRRDDPKFREFDVEAAAAALAAFGLETATLPIVWTPSVASDEIQKFKALLEKEPPNRQDIKDRAIRALRHARQHHDVSLMLSVVRELPQGYWENGFASWLRRFSPIRLNTETGRLYQIKRDSHDYRDYDIEGAMQADIIRDRMPVPIHSLLSGRPIRDVERDLAGCDHMSLMEGFRECVSEILKRGVGDTPAARGVLSGFSYEWLRRYQANDFFYWPTTDASPGTGAISVVDAPNFGMFSALGYRVGKMRGQSDQFRKFVLDQIFALNLPPIDGPEYMHQWGEPSTAARLKKMAHFIAQEIKNAKRRRSHDMRIAIAEWSSDYEYLHAQYYIGRFAFAFPPA